MNKTICGKTNSQKTATKIALLVADLDGTLLNPDKEITDKANTAICKLREAEIQLSLTSGRPPRGMRMYIEGLKITTPSSGFDGGIIFHPDLSIIEEYFIPQNWVQSVFDTLSKHQLAIWVYTAQDWLVHSRHGPYVDHEEHTVQFSPSVVDDLSKTAQQLIKITGVSDDYDAVARCEKEMQQSLAGHVTAARSQPYYLDITHPKANKGTVIQTLSRLLKVPLSQIATIGDMPSDIYMFKNSGLSIAMGNASDNVKHQADQVTTSNQEEGFANAIEHFLLGYSLSV